MLLNLSTGQQLTVDEAVAEMRSASVGEFLDRPDELRHAEQLIETLVQERDDLTEQVETLHKLLAHERFCREQAEAKAAGK